MGSTQPGSMSGPGKELSAPGVPTQQDSPQSEYEQPSEEDDEQEVS